MNRQSECAKIQDNYTPIKHSDYPGYYTIPTIEDYIIYRKGDYSDTLKELAPEHSFKLF